MSGGDEQRAKRLAEALRQNLRRRKAQARGSAGDADGAGEFANKGDPRPTE